MNIIEKFLKQVAKFQYKYAGILLVLLLVMSTFMVVGVTKIRMQSDMSKNFPDDMPINILNDRVSDKFGSQDIIVVLLSISENHDNKNSIKDIRDYRVVNYIIDLTNELELASSIDSVTSFGNAFSNNIDQATLDYALKQSPELNQFISSDFKSTFLLIRADVGADEKKVTALSNLVQEKIDTLAKPPGIDIDVTGSPPMRVTLLEILGNDAVYTLLVALGLIFIFLIFMEGSFIKALLVSFPLLFALIWTIGTMGWVGLEISVGTAGLGAMILGLGVEYGVFMLTRYHEEKEKGKSTKESLETSVPAVGFSILGSSLTTMTGFLALTVSIMPVLQTLGLSLAIGIFYCLFSAVFVGPVVFVQFEKLEHLVNMRLKKFIEKEEAMYNE